MFENLIGLVLGDRYEIQTPLGSRGMALAFVAHDRRLDCQVIVKILRPEYSWSADTIAKLEHPHILGVCDQGKHTFERQALSYFVMRLPKGGTLADRLTGQTLRPEDAERILRQVCEALDCAHSRGLIHSSLKPRDILFDEHGQVLLTDFKPVQPLIETTEVTAQADRPRKQSLRMQADLFTDVCNLSTALYRSVLIPLDQNRTAWRRWALSAGMGLALVVTMAGLILLGVWPPPLGGSERATYATASPTASVLPSATPTQLPSPTITIPAATTTASPMPSPTLYLVVSVERLRILAGPGEIYEVWGEVRRGDQLPLRGRSEDGMWWQVGYFDKEGWVRAQPADPNIDPTVLPTVEAPPTPIRTPTLTPAETATPSLPEPNTLLPLQNSGFDGIQENFIPGWHWRAEDNVLPDMEPDPTSFDTPFFRRTDDPARMIDGPTLQMEARAFVKFKVYISQTVSVPPAITVRFLASAKAYSERDGIKLKAGIDPNGSRDCSQVQWGDARTIDQSSGTVQLVAPDVAVGEEGRVTVCLYAETLYPARSNAAFFDNAALIANPE